MAEVRNMLHRLKAKIQFEIDCTKTPESFVRLIRKLAEKKRLKAAWSNLNRALLIYPRHAKLVNLAEELPPHYDETFYDDQGEGSLRSSRQILRTLHAQIPFRSVVDVGAGIGTWLRAASELGIDDLTAIEGEWVKDNRDRFQKANYIFQDLNSSFNLDRTADLALSVEVAEHLKPDRGEGMVKDMCRVSDLVLFGAAMPRQAGTGHINGRPHSYWIDLFEKEGYRCYDLVRPNLWNNKSIEPWYRQNTFLYAAPSMQDKLSNIPQASLVDNYHPLLTNSLVKKDARLGVIDPALDVAA